MCDLEGHGLTEPGHHNLGQTGGALGGVSNVSLGWLIGVVQEVADRKEVS